MASTINATTASGGGVITTADASGVLQLQTGGTTAVTVDASQNVGIGTSSPSAKLDVNGGIKQATSNWFAFGSDNTFYSDSSYGLVIKAPATSNFIAFRSSNDTERMRITAAGLVQYNNGYGSVATAYGCRAWVNFNGEGTVAIRASGNVTSITDNSTGNYTVNFTTAMPDANYVVTDSLSGGGSVVSDTMGGAYLYSTSSFTINTRQGNNTQADRSTVACAVFR